MNPLIKIISWIVNTPLHEEQNKILKLQRERLELKNKIQFERIERRRRMAEHTINVASLYIYFIYKKQKAVMIFDLLENSIKREIKPRIVRICRNEKKDYWIHMYKNNAGYSDCLEFVTNTSTYIDGGVAWLNGLITLEDLRAFAEKVDDALRLPGDK